MLTFAPSVSIVMAWIIMCRPTSNNVSYFFSAFICVWIQFLIYEHCSAYLKRRESVYCSIANVPAGQKGFRRGSAIEKEDVVWENSLKSWTEVK